ncbi:MAG: biosynthetic arginine decarboxylase [Candidatus Eisenbacteria bacterium]|nr:biosynthetic arginine decarboxylase [Candidatus Eisenbacteria bacterium]MCC7144428.1 biosynthetic arginine decarboxylase [Candidatus Eisenbacteria bacterium]
MENTFKTPIHQIYGIENWGNGYFDVNALGHLVVKPKRGAQAVDVFQVVEEVRKRHRLHPPILLRFPQILETQVKQLCEAFQSAIAEFQYGNTYQGVFPIKVNHRRDVVEELMRVGNKYRLGLEVGSKPELYIGLGLEQAPGSLLVCNGFKDDEFMEMAFWGQRTGKQVVIVVEQIREIYSYVKWAEATGLRPIVGLRGRLYSKGSGKWEESGGETSKFGLSTLELLECFRVLREANMLPALRMLHFHIGSQITDIRKIKSAVKEASRVYAKFRRMKAPIEYLNVGGGLGVDYDGSRTPSDSSVNYTIQEFANDVVYTVREICEHEDVPTPTLVSESGRALTVYHSVVVFTAENRGDFILGAKAEVAQRAQSPALTEMREISREISVKNFREYFHDAIQQREELFSLFDLGYLGLEERAYGEVLFKEICEKALRFAKETKFTSDEFEILEKALRKKYVTNMSVFQSVPDSFTIRQLFPVLPIHRLDEFPSEYGMLIDLTCDSDGKIDNFVDVKDIKEVLELHPTSNGGPYYLAICLVGAYQDVMGDFHNLFGTVNEAHVIVDEGGTSHIRNLIRGNTIEEVAGLNGYDPEDLISKLAARVAEQTRLGQLDSEEGMAILEAYRRRAGAQTYLSLSEGRVRADGKELSPGEGGSSAETGTSQGPLAAKESPGA